MPQENKERYTPGPWKAERRTVFTAEFWIVDGQGEWVANVFDDTSPNARLIAEAPAMFPLLKQYLKQHAEMHGGADCTCLDCRAARRIVARVLGEEK